MLATVLLLAIADAAPFQGRCHSDKRQLASSYDYVIVGGGASGLTVANRLTEDTGKLSVCSSGPTAPSLRSTLIETDMGFCITQPCRCWLLKLECCKWTASLRLSLSFYPPPLSFCLPLSPRRCGRVLY